MLNIAKVIYINLEHRTDRNVQVQEQLLQVFPPEKIVRLNATYNPTNGAAGCSYSHVCALKMAMAENYENCLIVEDDATWANNISGGNAILAKLMTQEPAYDVILLGGVLNYGHGAPDAATYRVRDAQTTTAYVVARHYYATLLANFEESYSMLTSSVAEDKALWALDQTWKKLQITDTFFMVYPVLMYQRESYSDIQKYHVNYEMFFTQFPNKIGIVIVCTNAYFVLGIRFVKQFMHHYKGKNTIHFYLFTDTDPKPYVAPSLANKITFIPTTHANWQEGTNSKFANFLQLQQDAAAAALNHLFYFDADTNVTADFTEEWFMGDIVAGEHYNNIYKNAEGLPADKPFDRNPLSAAYVPFATPLPQMYYYGAFFGGTTDNMMAFCNTLCTHQAADRAMGYEPVWNDESYINQHFHYHPPTKVVLTHKFPFVVSDKGGLENTRDVHLDVQYYKDKMLQNPTQLINLQNEEIYFSNNKQKTYLYGPWIKNPDKIDVLFVALLPTGEKVYVAQDGIHTKLVTEWSGVAKYYTGAPNHFNVDNWDTYLDANKNYKLNNGLNL